jgi:hypothetical protein
MPVVARTVDVVQITSGSTLACDSTRETIILIEGQALLEDAAHRAIGIIGAGRAVGSPFGSDSDLRRITAISTMRCVVIARRELAALLRIAPGVAHAVAAEIDPDSLPVGYPDQVEING